MASYKTHSLFNILLALPLSVYLLLRQFHFPQKSAILFSLAFIYTTLFMSPDLDLVHQIKPFSLRGFLSLPFRFYSRVFRHRGMSHWPLIGSLTRILWLAVPAIALLYFFEKLPPRLFWTSPPVLAILLGVAIADLCHLLLDLKLR